MWSGANACQYCRSRKILKNVYLDAKIGVDTAEDEPSEVAYPRTCRRNASRFSRTVSLYATQRRSCKRIAR